MGFVGSKHLVTTGDGYEVPTAAVWGPLAHVKPGDDVLECSMFMYCVDTVPGGRISAYKNIVTRRYLFLDDTGDAYTYGGSGNYTLVPLEVALKHYIS